MTEEKALELRPTDPVPGETPLLPEVVRAYPFSWGDGFAWPPETEESDRSLGYARAVLEACLPREPPAEPEPPGERGNAFEDEYGGWPEWSAVRRVLRGRISYASEVTRASMERAEAECAALGLDTTAFTERWVLRIKGWIAEETLYWCGLMVDDEQALAPWLPELAERYARRGFAARGRPWSPSCAPRRSRRARTPSSGSGTARRWTRRHASASRTGTKRSTRTAGLGGGALGRDRLGQGPGSGAGVVALRVMSADSSTTSGPYASEFTTFRRRTNGSRLYVRASFSWWRTR